MTSGPFELHSMPIRYEIDELVALSKLLGRSPRQILSRRFRAWAWQKFAAPSPLAGSNCYAISRGALRISSPKSSSDVKWSAFTDARRVGERLLLFVSLRQAFIIPNRAFGEEEDFEKFAEAASQCWEMGFCS